jgi:hypothetical protein
MLGNAAQQFKKHYLSYLINEARTTTSLEDMDSTIAYFEEYIRVTPFSQIIDDAINDGIIDSSDDIYTVE